MLQQRTSWYLNEAEPPKVSEKCTALVPKRKWPILVTNFNVLDHAEASSQRLNWYVNKTDLFETFLQCLTDALQSSTNLRYRNDVPSGT